MGLTPIICARCGKTALKLSGGVNRSRRIGAPLFCGKDCSGLHRRANKSAEQKREEKAEYDRQRRAKLGEELLAQKRAAYRAEVETNLAEIRAKQKQLRQRRAPRHAEYVRRPEYRKWKAEYDRKHRANKQFGPFGEAAILLRDLEVEILSRCSRYEISLANGTLNKRNNRRRDYDRQANGS